jgi:hypothetical protein
LNYEANTSELPQIEKTKRDRAKRKIKNYKLKHSRMLTCYSAVLYLLFVYDRNQTVRPQDAQNMVSLTPTQRIEFVENALAGSEFAPLVHKFLEKYERFLEVTSTSEENIIELFSNEAEAHQLTEDQSDFGDLAYKILYSIGHENSLYRRLVI